MKCKKCSAELPENSSVCPACGAEVKAGMSTTTKLTIVIVSLVVLIAVLVGIIVMGVSRSGEGTDTTAGTTAAQGTVPADGDPADVTCKGTYTDIDDAVMAANTEIIATLGDEKLTNGELNVYYWMGVYNFLNYNSSYVSYYGLDLSKPLDTQVYTLDDSGMTWQQYFLQQALETWQRFRGLTNDALEAGFVMDEDYVTELEGMKASMEAEVEKNGYKTLDDMLADQLGGGCLFSDYESYMYEYYMGYLYYDSLCAKITLTDAEVDAYYQEHKEEYKTNGLTEDMFSVDVRHILLQPKGCTFDANNLVVATEEQWEACRVEAQAMLDDWLANDGTEDGFAALAKEHTADGNGNVGGLYENVFEGDMVETFNDWCFDAARVSGDSGLVKTEFGYHIMYFVESQLLWPMYAREDLMYERQDALMKSVVEENPIQVSYDKILLADVALVTAN